jgi:hypothetical protein
MRSYRNHPRFLASLMGSRDNLDANSVIKKLRTMCVRSHPSRQNKNPTMIDVVIQVHGRVVTLVRYEPR